MRNRPHRVPPRLLELARALRHEQAPAEKKLWFCLRDRRLNGLKFRRQVPVGSYVADFYCAVCKLIVELDGSSHFDQEEYDAKRTEWLASHGYGVVRYLNSDVHKHLEAVLNNLLNECERRCAAGEDTAEVEAAALVEVVDGPSPPPSPLSTGERGLAAQISEGAPT